MARIGGRDFDVRNGLWMSANDGFSPVLPLLLEVLPLVLL